MKRLVIILCLILCLIAFGLTWTALQPIAPPLPTAGPPDPRVLVSTKSPTQSREALSPAARKPLKITSKGKVRLKPRESAVLGYWEIGPGMNGMAIVTPEATPDGHVKMVAKLLQMSDAAVSDADAQDLFPDLFDFENYSAISPERLSDLQTALQTAGGADLLSAPTVLTRPGQAASISIGNAEGAMLSLDLQANPGDDNGSYDLRIGLQRQE